MEAGQIWLLGLMALWAALLFGGFIFGKESPDHTRRMPAWTRMASSFTLVVAAWSYWLWINQMATTHSFSVGFQSTTMGLFFAIAMTLGFIGDLFMAELLIKGENHVLGGIASFGLGHIAYIAGMLRFITYYPDRSPHFSWLPLGLWLLFGLIGWYVIVFRAGERTMMHYAALPYTLLLSTTAGVASTLAAGYFFRLVAIGAALFLLSDLILAAQLFRKAHFRYISDVVWFTYGPGQMLLVLGFWLVSPLSPF
ncbi:MAG TPA: lysoplasmalogenase [Phototrophicaceae bacterium]|nr:lysoplasmalogenase [Phototrophicaceae bacterium]